MQFPSLILKPKRERSLIHRHPWLFSGAVQTLPPAEDGDIVTVKSFEGKALERVEIDFPHGDTKLWFEGSLMLRLIPIHAETYEHWLLYTPTGTLIFGPGTEWQFEAETLKTATL